MDSSNPSWRSPKAHSGHAITQETRTHSVGITPLRGKISLNRNMLHSPVIQQTHAQSLNLSGVARYCSMMKPISFVASAGRNSRCTQCALGYVARCFGTCSAGELFGLFSGVTFQHTDACVNKGYIYHFTRVADQSLFAIYLYQCPACLQATARVTPQTAQRQPGAAATSARSPQASSRKQLFIVPQRRSRVTQQPDADKPVAFAVQLYPDMSSLTLAQPGHQQGSPTVFSGGEAPDHHGYTAVHDYIASVCPNEAAAFGADVWLDTFHTTLGDLELPMSKVPEFQHSINTIVADSLRPESLANLTYTTTQLGYTKKENRLKKDIKGVHFYHLGVKAPADQLAEFLQPWMAAMQRAAAAVGAKFVDKPFSEHHITIRCHTKKPVDRQVLQKVSNAVQHSPFSLRVAGIRVQLAASQALDLCGPEHIKTHVGSDGSEVRYPVPIFTSGAAASVLLERGHQAPCPPRAIPCNAPESEDGAGIEEVTRLTAEPLVVPAQNGTGFVWQSKLCLLLSLLQSALRIDSLFVTSNCVLVGSGPNSALCTCIFSKQTSLQTDVCVSGTWS